MKASKFLRLKALWEKKEEVPLSTLPQSSVEVKSQPIVEEPKQEVKEEVKEEEIPVVKQAAPKPVKKKIDEQPIE